MEHQDPTHVVCFDHPNSQMPTGYGTARVEEGHEDEILRQAIATDPHHPEVSDDDIAAVRENATIYRVADRDRKVQIDRMALAQLADNAREDLPYCEGEHAELLQEAIHVAEEALEADE